MCLRLFCIPYFNFVCLLSLRLPLWPLYLSFLSAKFPVRCVARSQFGSSYDTVVKNSESLCAICFWHFFFPRKKSPNTMHFSISSNFFLSGQNKPPWIGWSDCAMRRSKNTVFYICIAVRKAVAILSSLPQAVLCCRTSQERSNVHLLIVCVEFFFYIFSLHLTASWPFLQAVLWPLPESWIIFHLDVSNVGMLNSTLTSVLFLRQWPLSKFV